MQYAVQPDPQSAAACWPYPLLCLSWRLNLGGHWVLAPQDVANQVLVTRARELLAAAHHDPSTEAAFASTRLDRLLQADSNDALFRLALLRLLERSPLGRLSASHPAHRGAIVATCHMILAEGMCDGVRRQRRLPLFWRRALSPALAGASRFYVPTAKPVWDPATWQLIEILDSSWNADGVTFVGRERRQLFLIAGTRRMAARYGWPRRRTLACGRTAYHVWRVWFKSKELARLSVVDRHVLPPEVARIVGSPRLLYRQAREALRTQAIAENLEVLRSDLRHALEQIAAESVLSLQAPVTAQWAQPPAIPPLATVLVRTPLGLVARDMGASHRVVFRAAHATAVRLMRAMTAPWRWTPWPVVIGPRRAMIEARRKGPQGGRGDSRFTWGEARVR
ncbi:MAG: hypothetical protein ACT4PE_10195 [Candidatus Eiseniibacteriota bacterium]